MPITFSHDAYMDFSHLGMMWLSAKLDSIRWVDSEQIQMCTDHIAAALFLLATLSYACPQGSARCFLQSVLVLGPFHGVPLHCVASLSSKVNLFAWTWVWKHLSYTHPRQVITFLTVPFKAPASSSVARNKGSDAIIFAWGWMLILAPLPLHFHLLQKFPNL